MEDPLAPSSVAPSPREEGAASLVVRRRIVQWDAQGNPVVSLEPMVTSAQVRDLHAAAVARPFSAPDPVDPDHKYDGLPMIEVMVLKKVERAARSGESEEVLDRLVGRPKQTTETTKLTVSYEDALREIERKEALKSASPAPRPAVPAFLEAEVVTTREEGIGGVLDI